VAAAVDKTHSAASPTASRSKASAPGTGKKNGANSPSSAHSNPIAHEVQVIVAGARPCEAGGKRELFTEETTSVLVFERGGVLRLTAAVAAGQLLFLTNKQTKREVVAQVGLKRDFKPMNCFCEVEFTEPAPGFWGIEFPGAPPEYVLSNSQQENVAKTVQAAKPVAAKPKVQPPVPSAEEVAALKQQVEALREQLKSLQEQTAAETSPAHAPVSATMAAPNLQNTEAQDSVLAFASEGAVSREIRKPTSAVGCETPQEIRAETSEVSAPARTAEPTVRSSLPIDHDEEPFSEENLLPKPALDFSQARATPKRASKSKQKVPKSSSSGALRKSLLFAALLLAAAGAAWYQNLIPGLPQPKKLFAAFSPSSSPTAVAHPVPTVSAVAKNATEATPDPKAATPAVGAPVPTSESTSPAPSSTLPNDASLVAASPSATLQSKTSLAAGQPAVSLTDAAAKSATAGEAKSSTITASEVPGRSDAVSAALREKSTVATSAAKRSAPRTMSNTALVSAVPSEDGAAVVPPKLIKSVRAIAAPEALQDFATGDVKLDAVVDATGRVKSMKAIAGPPSLRTPAMDALKEYRYEPARRNGKPVAAHVTVTIKFLFEP
jgi:hypothetical protein